MDNTAPLFDQQCWNDLGVWIDMGMTLEDISHPSLLEWYASLNKALGVVYSLRDPNPFYYEFLYTEMNGAICPVNLKIHHPQLETSLIPISSVQNFHHGVRTDKVSMLIDSAVNTGISIGRDYNYSLYGTNGSLDKRRLAEAGNMSLKEYEDDLKKGYVVYDYKTPQDVYSDISDYLYLKRRNESIVSPFEETIRYEDTDGCPNVLRGILHKFSKEPVFTSLQNFDSVGRDLVGQVPVTTDYPVHQFSNANYAYELIPMIGYILPDWCIADLGTGIPLTDYHVLFKTSTSFTGAPVYDIQWEYGFDRFGRDSSNFDYRFFFTKQLKGLLEIWKECDYYGPDDSALWISIRKSFSDEIVILFHCEETETEYGVYYDDVLNSMVTLGCTMEYE